MQNKNNKITNDLNIKEEVALIDSFQIASCTSRTKVNCYILLQEHVNIEYYTKFIIKIIKIVLFKIKYYYIIIIFYVT